MSYTNQDAPYGTGVTGQHKYGTDERTDDNFGTTKPNTFDSTRTGDTNEYTDRFDNTSHNATGGTQGLTSRNYGADSTVTGYNQGAAGRGGVGNQGFASTALGDNYADNTTGRTADPTNPNAFGSTGTAPGVRTGTDLYNTDNVRRQDQYGQNTNEDFSTGTRDTTDTTYAGTGAAHRDVDPISNTAHLGRRDDDTTHHGRRRGSRSRSRSRSPHNQDSHDRTTGKVPVGEKIKGTLEQVKGKVTKNPELVQQGIERKTGQLGEHQYGGDRTNEFGSTGLAGDEDGNTRRTDDDRTTGRYEPGQFGTDRRPEGDY